MEKNIYDLPSHIQRVVMITHIHELSVKSERCDQLLKDMYDKMLSYAEAHGIRVSTVLPVTEEVP